MKRAVNSLITKLILSFLVLILIISLATFLYTYSAAKNAIKYIMQNEVKEIIGTAASQITDEQIEVLKSLKPGEDNTEKYLTLANYLVNLRSNSKDVVNFYIFKKSADQIEFLLDDAIIVNDGPALIGEIYEDPDAALVNNYGEITASDDFYTDEWGTFLSGYAPIKDSNGNLVAVIGADVNATNVIAKQNFIGKTIYVVIAIGIVLAAVIVGLFALTIIKDINKLNRIANKVSMGEMDVKMDVKRSDEIGDLAKSFGRMVASLKIMMMDKDG